jgi:outer membrane protein, adhesin transport system
MKNFREFEQGSRMPHRTFLSSTALVLLIGCGTSQTQITDMRTEIDNRLKSYEYIPSTSSGAAPAALTRELLPSLLVAVLTNEGYLAALAAEQEALAQIGVAASIRRPQVSAGANVGGIRETGTNGSTSSGLAGGLNLSQLVYDGGASVSAINRSTALALSAQAARMTQGNDLALSAARAWIDLWQYSERLRLMRARTSEMDTLVEQIERMASNGMLDRASLDSARRQIVNIKLEEMRLQAGRSEAEVMFKRFFHAAPSVLNRPAELVSPAMARKFAVDWHQAPALQRQAAELLAARAAVEEARAAFRPRARLQAGARSPLERDESTELTVGLSLEYTFNDGGRRKKQLEAAEARLTASEAQLKDAQRGLEAELQSGLTRLASLESSMPLVADKLQLSRSEAQTSRSQMLTGQSNLRQLVEAEIEIYRTQDQQIAMLADRYTLLLTIASRTGALAKVINLSE